MKRESVGLGAVRTRHMDIRIINKRIDVIAAVISACTGVFILSLCFLGRANIYVTGFFIFFASILYLIFRKKILQSNGISQFRVSNRLKLLNHIVFIASVTGSIWLLWTTLYYRPLIYFVLVAIACGSIAGEALYSEKKEQAWLVLLKIIIVGITVRAGIYYGFPGIHGSDPLFHNAIIQDVFNSGHIPETIIFRYNSYRALPVFHIEAAAVQLITGLTTNNAIFISIGFLQVVVTAILIFLIGQRIADLKMGLLAALAIIMSDSHIAWGVSIIPMTLGFCYFLFILYMILHESETPTLTKALFIIFSGLLILTHTIASVILLTSLIAIFVGMRIYNHLMVADTSGIARYKVPLGYISITLFVVLMIAYWMYNFYGPRASFLEVMVDMFVSTVGMDTQFAGATVATQMNISIFEFTLTRLGYSMFLGGGIIGACTWLSMKERNEHRITLISVVVLLLMLIYSFSAFNLRTILPARWYVFLYAPLSIIFAQGLISVARIMRNNKARVWAGILVMTVLSFSMLTYTSANAEGKLHAEKIGARHAFTESELAALERAVDMSDGHFETDVAYKEQVPYRFGYDIYRNMMAPTEKDIFILSDYSLRCLLIRNRLMERLAQKDAGAIFGESAQITRTEYVDAIGGSGWDLVYDNGNVWIYGIR